MEELEIRCAAMRQFDHVHRINFATCRSHLCAATLYMIVKVVEFNALQFKVPMKLYNIEI